MKTIFIVEDDDDNRSVLEMILTTAQYSVVSCSDAHSFNIEIQRFFPDLIVLDIALPDGDGRKICKDLKANPSTASIPVVLLAAYPDLKAAKEECGANAFLDKPFDIDELLGVIVKNVH